MLKSTTVAPIDKQHFFESSELYSHIEKQRKDPTTQQVAPLVQLNQPPKEGEDDEV